MKGLLSKLFQSVDVENRKVILSLCEYDASAKVLDCGCGNGEFTVAVGNKVGTDELYGIEIADEYRQLAERKGIKRVRSVDLNEPLPFDSGTFDVICANQVLEHLHHTDLFIKEIRRLLKAGGYAVISTPNLAAWHNVLWLFLGWQPFVAALSDEINIGNPLWPSYKMKAAGGKYPAHRRIPTYRGAKELFEYHGFQIESIHGVGWYPFPMKVARILTTIDPRHAVYLTIKARKPSG